MAKALSVKLKIDADGNVSGVVNGINNDLKKMGGQVDKVSDSTDRLTSSLKHVGHYGLAAFAGWGLSNLVGDVVNTTKEMQSLQASLVTVKGSAVEADKAFSQIQEFAKTTPYQLTEVTDAFIKMEALGLTASERAMRSYGDTASSMGKSLNQMVEAVADAATGEFERLKEFGIKASSEGDKVTFTFKGVATEVGKNAAEIEAYLMQLGEVNFAGGMKLQMEALGGQLSNLEDNWAQTLNALGEASQPAISAAIGGLNDLADGIESAADYMDEAALLVGVGLTTALTAKAIPAIWATSTAFNAATVSAGGFAAATRAATAAALVFAATPLGLAVTAVAGTVAYLALREDEAEVATRDLTEALAENNVELSRGEFKKRAEQLKEYRQELNALMTMKSQNKAVDIFGYKEDRLKENIRLLLETQSYQGMIYEQDREFKEILEEDAGYYDEKAEALKKYAQTLNWIAQVENDWNNESAAEKASIQEKINKLTLTEVQQRQLILDKLQPENRALMEKLFALQDAEKANEAQLKQHKEFVEWADRELDLIEQQDNALNNQITVLERKANSIRFGDAYNAEIQALNEINELYKLGLISAEELADAKFNATAKALGFSDALDTDAFSDAMDLFEEIREASDFTTVWDENANAVSSAFSQIARESEDYFDFQKDQQEKLDKVKAADFENEADRKKAVAELEAQNTRAMVNYYGYLAGAIAGAFEEGSTAAQAFTAVQQGIALYDGIGAVIKAWNSAPFPYNVPIVAATSASVAALLAQMGQSFSGGSSAPSGMLGTATAGGRLGQSETDTYSLESSLDRMLELESDQYHELKGINDGVRSLNDGIVSSVTGMHTTGFAESVNAGLYSRYGGLGQDFANGFDIPGVDIITGFASSIVDKVFGSGTVAKISNSIFGGKTTVYDPRLEFAGTVLDPDFWAEQTKKVDGGWLSSDKKSTIGIDLNTRLIEQFDQIFDSVEDTADAIGEQLGLTEQQIDAAVSGVDLAETLGEISLEGEAEEITERLSEAFSMVADAVGYELAPDLINKFAQLGETYFDTLTRVVTDKVVVEDIFKISGQSVGTVQAISALSAIGNFETLDYVTLNADIYEVSQSLVKLAGGVSELRDAASDYFSEFFTEEEQFSKLTQDLKNQFTTINSILPATREGYRTLVEQQNLGVEADRERYVSLLQLSDMADQYYDKLEDGAEQSAEAVKQAAQEIASAWASLRGSFASYTQAIGLDDASLVAQQKADLQSAYDDEVIAINAQIDSLNTLISTSNESVNSLKSLSSQLSGAFDSILGQSLDVSLERYSIAQAELLQYANQGIVPAGEELSRLLGIVTQNSTDNYSSRADYLRDQMLTANAIGDLNGIVDGQLSAEEQTLQSLKDQLKLEQDALKLSKISLDNDLKQIDLAQEQKELAEALIDLTKDVAEYINTGFEELDTSLDGVIDWNEFKSAFGGLATEETLNKIWNKLDMNLDGVVSSVESNLSTLEGSRFNGQSILDYIFAIDAQSGAGLSNEDIKTIYQSMLDTDTTGQQVVDAFNEYAPSLNLTLKQLVDIVEGGVIGQSDSSSSTVANNTQPNASSAPAPSITPTDIRAYIGDLATRWDENNDGIVDEWAAQEIATTGQALGVSMSQLAGAMGWSTGDIQSVLDLYGIPEFALGGYTANIATNQIAGVVHGGEYVAPNHQIKRYPELFAALDKERGFKDGGPVNFRMPTFNNGQTDNGFTRLEKQVERLIENQEAIEAQLGRVAVATENSDEKLDALNNGVPTYNMQVINV